MICTQTMGLIKQHTCKAQQGCCKDWEQLENVKHQQNPPLIFISKMSLLPSFTLDFFCSHHILMIHPSFVCIHGCPFLLLSSIPLHSRLVGWFLSLVIQVFSSVGLLSNKALLTSLCKSLFGYVFHFSEWVSWGIQQVHVQLHKKACGLERWLSWVTAGSSNVSARVQIHRSSGGEQWPPSMQEQVSQMDQLER